MIEKNNYIQFNNLKQYSDVEHLFTKIPFDFNQNNIEKEKLNLQYKEIQKIMNYKFKKIKKPIQTHTNVVKKVDITNLNDEFKDVDGLVTNLKGVALVISVADCQGLILYDNNKRVIGNIHSGWKGTLNRITSNAIKLMIKEYGCNVKDIEVYICPSILKCCFEVDEDVKEMFKNEFSDIKIDSLITKDKIKEGKQKYYIDTVSINVEVLKNIGILERNIFKSNLCKKCHKEKFHSHRGTSNVDGRNVSVVVLKEV